MWLRKTQRRKSETRGFLLVVKKNFFCLCNYRIKQVSFRIDTCDVVIHGQSSLLGDRGGATTKCNKLQAILRHELEQRFCTLSGAQRVNCELHSVRSFPVSSGRKQCSDFCSQASHLDVQPKQATRAFNLSTQHAMNYKKKTLNFLCLVSLVK